MEITRKEITPGVVVLELKGQLQSGVECVRLGQAMDELLHEKQTRVIFDLSKTTKVDSAGLGRIVNCLSRLKTLQSAGKFDNIQMRSGHLRAAHFLPRAPQTTDLRPEQDFIASTC